MPERGSNHVLDRAVFAIGELNFYFLSLLAYTDDLSTNVARLYHAHTPALSTHNARSRRPYLADARSCPAKCTDLFFNRLAVPLRIVEMVMSLNKIVDREVVLAIVKSCTATDNLLELDHGVDRSHENDVSNV